MSNKLLLASAALAALALAGCNKKEEAPAEAPPAAEAAPAPEAAPAAAPAADAMAPSAEATAPAADAAAPAADVEGDDRTNPVNRGGTK